MKRKRGITIRFGPLGLSLLAAGITAVGVAAVSLADSGNGGSEQRHRQWSADASRCRPRPAARPAWRSRTTNLSGGGPAEAGGLPEVHGGQRRSGPPDPGKIDPSQGPPKPPSAADREKLQKAFEACKAKLPEKLQDAGPPGIGTFHCGPPPGAPPQQGQNQNQSNQSGTQSSGSTS